MPPDVPINPAHLPTALVSVRCEPSAAPPIVGRLAVAAIIGLCLIGALCSPSTSVRAQATPSPVPTDPPMPSGCEPWTVTRVIDGDTVAAEFRGDPYHLRYIGVDTPERGAPRGTEATELNRSLVEGQEVCVTRCVTDRDDFGRLLRLVWRSSDGLFVNAEMVRRGLAKTYVVSTDTCYSELFSAIQQQAYDERKGLWGLWKIHLPIAGLRGCVDINTASAADLQLLDEIGPVLAQAIIADRTRNGDFTNLDELDRVPGIGPATVAKIKAQGLACVTRSGTGGSSSGTLPL